MAIIELENISFKYNLSDDFSLENLNISLDKGEICAVTGATESGKTTLCYLLSGIIPHFTNGELKGNLIIDGINTIDSNLQEISLKTGFVMQNPKNQLSGIRFTVFEETGFSLENSGFQKKVMEEKIQEILELLEISHLSEKNPVFLSGGQLQRLAIASVLINQPEILILDSPFTQLDPAGSILLAKILKNLSTKGTAIFITGTDPGFIAELAHKVLVLHNGRSVLYGDPADVYTSDALENYGVEKPLPVQIAEKALAKKIWPENKEIPITIKQAAKGFKQWITQ